VVVRRAVSIVDGTVYQRSTKTGKVRRVAVEPAALVVLDRQRRYTGQRHQLAAVPFTGDSPVFPNIDLSGPMRPDSVTRAFVRLRKGAGLQHVRFHHLRHYAATVLLGAGVDIKTVSGRLGHSSPSLTMRTYAHVLESNDRRAAGILEDSLRPMPECLNAPGSHRPGRCRVMEGRRDGHPPSR
jgi:integrase